MNYSWGYRFGSIPEINRRAVIFGVIFESTTVRFVMGLLFILQFIYVNSGNRDSSLIFFLCIA